MVLELGTVMYSADLGSEISGVVSKDAGKPATIIVNNRHVNRRNRFTVAHELGHVVERKEIAADDEYSFEEFRGRKYDLHEFFADEFAGELLMPAFAVQEMKGAGVTPERMAEKFDVSVDAVNKRLARLAKHPE
jgi:Zn-dependent peptidase ImmA (M78 family)